MGNDTTEKPRTPSDPADPPVEGVRALDHTADIGIEVKASSLPELFRRAALTSSWLVLERPASDRTESRTIQATAPDLSMLMRSWLQEMLRLLEDEGFAAASVVALTVRAGTMTGVSGDSMRPEAAIEAAVEARVEGGPSPSEPVREIKGVTLHGLTVEERPDHDPDGRWLARVILDV